MMIFELPLDLILIFRGLKTRNVFKGKFGNYLPPIRAVANTTHKPTQLLASKRCVGLLLFVGGLKQVPDFSGSNPATALLLFDPRIRTFVHCRIYAMLFIF